MIQNYIRTAIRNFYRNKSITFIKIVGLAISMAATLYILTYVSIETSYNDYNLKKNNIFRVNQTNNTHGWKSVSTPYPLRDELLNTYPEIQKATRIIHLFSFNVKNNEGVFNEDQLLCVDSDFLEIFTIKKLYGNFTDIFEDINNIILTESKAQKYFGQTDITGESLILVFGNKEILFKVVAVIEDLPFTSTIKADFIASIDLGLNQANTFMTSSDGLPKDANYYRNSWNTNMLETFLLFDRSESALDFESKLAELEQKNFEDTTRLDFYLQNLGDIYLHSKELLGNEMLGDLESVYIFSAIAFLVLLIACINYIILSSSQIISRSKEIGMRKILGARQPDLFMQFLTESLIMVLITIPLAFILIEQFRPVLNQIFRKEIIIIYNLKFILGFVFILNFVVFIPALNIIYFLNRISPISILRKNILRVSNKFNFRKGLIVLQFVIFIVLVVMTIGMKKQLNYSTKGNLGYTVENKVSLNIADLISKGGFNTLKTELLKSPLIKSISGAMWLPPSNGRMSYSQKDTSSAGGTIKLEALFVDKDFIETMDFELIKGKSLSEFGTNADWKIVINQEAEKILGGKDIIGTKVWNGEVVGVVKDFKFHSFHETLKPTILIVGSNMIREMVVSFNNLDQNTLACFKNQLKEFSSELKAEPVLLTEKFRFLYRKEQRLSSLIGIFSTMAIFIASIGLLGLTIFTTKKQTKDIAVRKVHGSSILSIVKLLLKDYFKLIVLALFIASPIAFYFLDKWLQNFAYSTNIEWWIFAIAGILALSISTLTISWYSIKAARKNPVDSLRYE